MERRRLTGLILAGGIAVYSHAFLGGASIAENLLERGYSQNEVEQKMRTEFKILGMYELTFLGRQFAYMIHDLEGDKN